MSQIPYCITATTKTIMENMTAQRKEKKNAISF